MRTSKVLNYMVICLILLSFNNCNKKEEYQKDLKSHKKFDNSTFLIKENYNAKMVKGQVLYLPIYSNVPYFEDNKEYSMSGFVAIHNTDFNSNLKITKVLFFDNDGLLVSNYLEKDTTLLPLAAIDFFVPYADKSGTGANFIIEWVADTLITEPLVESVMLSLIHGQGVSFTSTGKILREIK
jgi:hypothetical protein